MKHWTESCPDMAHRATVLVEFICDLVEPITLCNHFLNANGVQKFWYCRKLLSQRPGITPGLNRVCIAWFVCEDRECSVFPFSMRWRSWKSNLNFAMKGKKILLPPRCLGVSVKSAIPLTLSFNNYGIKLIDIDSSVHWRSPSSTNWNCFSFFVFECLGCVGKNSHGTILTSR